VLAEPNLVPDGPHHFNLRGAASVASGLPARTRVLPPRLAMLLHFESASTQRWREKFGDQAAAEARRVAQTEAWMDDEGLTPEQRAQLRAAVLRKGPLAASGPSEVDPEQGTSGAGFYAASVSAMRDIQTASSSGDAAAAAAAEARAIALWRKWKARLSLLGSVLP